jgi:hypothetical protein
LAGRSIREGMHLKEEKKVEFQEIKMEEQTFTKGNQTLQGKLYKLQV